MVQSRRVDGARSLSREQKPTLVAIGNFDGVHLGHRAVLDSASREATSKGLALVVLTFHPHPAEVLGRGRHPVLTPLDRKIELLLRLDPGLRVVVEPFTKELSLSSPRGFAEGLLKGCLDAHVVVVGQNFRFGHNREGDLSKLLDLGRELGFEARAEPLAGDGEGPYSSSRVRAAIAASDVKGAARLLGRPHALSGTVVHGDGRGRQLGIPTANLAGVTETVPPHGVYACLVDRVDAEGRGHRLGTAAVNIGVRPTVAAGFSVEAHVHDFDDDLYGARLRLHLIERLRAEVRFPSIEALVLQVRKDVEAARDATRAIAADPAADGAWA